jgi:hypothetical protein
MTSNVDWTQAPEWARWWAVGGSNFDKEVRASWYACRPRIRNRGRCEYGYMAGATSGVSTSAPLFGNGRFAVSVKRP